jgi:hypothetical protein
MCVSVRTSLLALPRMVQVRAEPYNRAPLATHPADSGL